MENWEDDRNEEMKITREINNFGKEIDFIFFLDYN
jgi:hypothetical protein